MCLVTSNTRKKQVWGNSLKSDQMGMLYLKSPRNIYCIGFIKNISMLKRLFGNYVHLSNDWRFLIKKDNLYGYHKIKAKEILENWTQTSYRK